MRDLILQLKSKSEVDNRPNDKAFINAVKKVVRPKFENEGLFIIC